jgi:hypothetical protein
MFTFTASVECHLMSSPDGEYAVIERPVPANAMESDDTVRDVVAYTVNQVLKTVLLQLAPANTLLYRDANKQVGVEADAEVCTVKIKVPVLRVELSFDADPNNPSRTCISIAGTNRSDLERVAEAAKDVLAAEQSTQQGMDSDDDEFDACVDAMFKLKYPSYSRADMIADANSVVSGAEYGEYAHNLLRDMFNAKHDADAVWWAGRVMFEKGGRHCMECNFYNYRAVTMDMAKKAQIDERVYAEWWGGACVAINRAWERLGGWMA